MLIKGNCQIAGIGAYLPSQVVTSQELMREIKSEKNYGFPETWLNDICGIDERRVASGIELPSELAIKAAEVALKNAAVKAAEIDVVIFCGISREWIEPSVAHKVQHELGCTNAICFDVTNACHGFMNGILIADNLMQTSDATHVLVVTGEVSTDITMHYVEKLKQGRELLKKEMGIFTLGDAGAAFVLTPKDNPDRGFQYFNFHTNAEHTDLCKIYATKDGSYGGQMLMKEISNMIVKLHSQIIEKTYETLRWEAKDIDRMICHQVGKRPHQRMARMANVSLDIAPISYKNLGNITTATIPLNLYNASLKAGERVLIAGTGSGLSISQSGLVF